MERCSHHLPGDLFSGWLGWGCRAGGGDGRPLAQHQAGGRAGETSRRPEAGPAQLSGSKQLQVATKHEQEQTGVSGRWQQILLQALGFGAPA